MKRMIHAISIAAIALVVHVRNVKSRHCCSRFPMAIVSSAP